MIEFEGKYTTAKVMIDDIEETCAAQIVELINHPAFTNPVAIMPDTHAGAGSVIGFTMPLTDKVVPNTIGVDIGCGMLSFPLTDKMINAVELEWLDKAIREAIPFGFNVNEKITYDMERYFPWDSVSRENRIFCLAFNGMFDAKMKPTVYDYEWFKKKCEQIGANLDRSIASIGSLGGGNHFIEIGKSANTGKFWLTIHTGSRQFGLQICKYWQNMNTEKERHEALLKLNEGIKHIKATHVSKADHKKIPTAINKLRSELGINNKVAKGLDYIEGEDMQGYLTDMIFAQAYAAENRHRIANVIAYIFEPPTSSYIEAVRNHCIETVHNYIDFKDFVIRKGAISAHRNDIMIIPFNMEDGILVCKGRGNKEWNNSAPHGAGRLESRAQAKIKFSSSVAKERMKAKGIFTSAVPVDEVKEAYKDPKIIEEAIEPTVEIVDRLIPIMNLKDNDDTMDRKKRRKLWIPYGYQ